MDRKEAIEIVRKIYPHVGTSGSEFEAALRELVPELKENENETIRNEIIAFIEQAIHRGGGTLIPKEKEDKWISYLERQKEQKPVKLNDDTEIGLDRALQIVNAARGTLSGYQTDDGVYECDHAIQTLERILKNGIEQKPTEKHDLVAQLKEHLANTPKEQLEAEWKELEKWNHVGPTVKEYLSRVNPMLSLAKKELDKPTEWSDDFEENISILLHDKLTWRSDDGKMSSTVSIDDKTLKDIISGIWFYVGKEALKYPNKELNVSEWSKEDEKLLDAMIDMATNSLYEPLCPRGKMIALLKSHRPKLHWKPSEKQINALKVVARGYPSDDLDAIESLLNDLQKLL